MATSVKSSSQTLSDDNSEIDFQIEEGEDALKRLGIGILTHFTMQRTYMCFFLFLTLINLPLYLAVKSTTKQTVADYENYSIGELSASQN